MGDNDTNVTEPTSSLPGYGNAANLMGTPAKDRVPIEVDMVALAQIVIDCIEAPYLIPSQVRAGVLATWDTLTGVGVEQSATLEKAQACVDTLGRYARAVVDGTADLTFKERA